MTIKSITLIEDDTKEDNDKYITVVFEDEKRKPATYTVNELTNNLVSSDKYIAAVIAQRDMTIDILNEVNSSKEIPITIDAIPSKG